MKKKKKKHKRSTALKRSAIQERHGSRYRIGQNKYKSSISQGHWGPLARFKGSARTIIMQGFTFPDITNAEKLSFDLSKWTVKYRSSRRRCVFEGYVMGNFCARFHSTFILVNGREI